MSNVNQLNDVFGINMPRATEIDRASEPELERFSDEITRPGYLIRLYGPSKSGKTVLVRQIMRRRGKHPIEVRGSNIKRKDDFWINLAVSAPDRFANVGDDVPMVLQLSIIDYCKQSMRPIVIDDFHGIAPLLRKPILESLKQLTDEGVNVVIISIVDVVADMMLRDRGLIKDFEKRTVGLKAPTWTRDDIKEIGKRGFAALGWAVGNPSIEMLARNAFANPLLMQALCERLCRRCGVRDSMGGSGALAVDADILKETITAVAAIDRELNDVFWARGGGSYKLKSGKKINLRGLILLSISHMTLAVPLKTANARKEMRELLLDKKETPTLDEIRKAATELVESAEKAGRTDSGVLYYNDLLFVTHPFFKLYLLWVLYPAYTGEYPDIANFMEKIPDDADVESP